MSADMSKPGPKDAARQANESSGDLTSASLSGSGVQRVISYLNRIHPVEPVVQQAARPLGKEGLLRFMERRAEAEQSQEEQGKNDATTFLKSIEALKGRDWDRAVQDRIFAVEYSHDDDSPLTVRDCAEIKVLDQALRDVENERYHDAMEAADEAGRRHDEWMDELTIQANAYPESDMPK